MNRFEAADAAWDASVDSRIGRACFSDLDDFSVPKDADYLLNNHWTSDADLHFFGAPVATSVPVADSQSLAAQGVADAPGVTGVHGFLGEGSCGYVFRCSVAGYNDEVAVKVLKGLDKTADSREAALASLCHPNLVQIQKVLCGPPLCFVMELCPGGTLGALLHDPQNNALASRFSAAHRARAALDAAKALVYLHSQCLVHRDVKSSNCFLSGMVDASSQVLPAVKLGDLGSCRKVEVKMTKCVGTFAYMAPEVAEGGTYGHSADIFSFGVMLNELLSGEKPFDGQTASHRIPVLICQGKRPALAVFASLGNEVGDALESLVQQSWGQDPLARPLADAVTVCLAEALEFYMVQYGVSI